MILRKRALTNADVSNMAKSGMGDQTILLVIEKGANRGNNKVAALPENRAATAP